MKVYFMYLIYIFFSLSDEIILDGNADETASDNGHHQTTLSEDSTTTGETRWWHLKKGQSLFSSEFQHQML